MANVAYPGATGIVGVTDAATFIPELWSDEIRAAYEKNLIVANLVKKMSMKGKKGDVIRVPAPVRGTAIAKGENTAVTIQMNAELDVTIPIDKHFEYSRLIEDIVEVQALSSLRKFYTDDAGYALARQRDTDLFNCGTGLGNGTYSAAPGAAGASWAHTACFYPSAATTLSAYAVDTVDDNDVMLDFHFRALIERMDNADVPMDGRSFIIPPSLRNMIMGVDRYVSSDFVNSGKVAGGKIGELYGIDIYVSSNCPVLESALENTAASTAKDIRGAFLIHKDTFVLAEQVAIRSQTQYKQEYLATLYTADTIYGVKAFRPDAGFILAIPG